MIGRTILHYEITGELGVGAFLARDAQSGRTVMLAVIPDGLAGDDGTRKRIMQDARAVSALKHNNMYTVLDFAQSEDGHWLVVTEYHEGETLKDRLARGSLGIEESFAIIAQVADGLDQAHQAGVVHGGIRPDRIQIIADGEVKILDFGVAKYTRDDSAYRAPEQTRGDVATERSDVYALGVLFREMLGGVNEMRLRLVIERMTAANPSDRYRTVEDAIQGLARVRAGAQVRKFITHQHRVTLLLAALVLLMAAGMWWCSFKK